MKQIFCILATAGLMFAAASGTKEEAEILSLMNIYKDAMIHNNASAMDKILSPDLAYVHSAGMLEGKADVLKGLSTGKNVVERIDYSDTSVRFYGNTALVRGRVDLWHSKTNIVHMNVLHVWVKGTDGWKMVSRQATKLAE